MRAVDRRLFTVKSGAFALAECAIQILWGLHALQPAQTASQDQTMTRERLVDELLSLEPIASKPHGGKDFWKVPDVALVHQSHLWMLIEQGIQQGGAGTKKTYDENRVCIIRTHVLLCLSNCYSRTGRCYNCTCTDDDYIKGTLVWQGGGSRITGRYALQVSCRRQCEEQLVGMSEMRGGSIKEGRRLSAITGCVAQDDPSAAWSGSGERSREGNWGGTLPLCPFRCGSNLADQARLSTYRRLHRRH